MRLACRTCVSSLACPLLLTFARTVVGDLWKLQKSGQTPLQRALDGGEFGNYTALIAGGADVNTVYVNAVDVSALHLMRLQVYSLYFY